MRILASMFHPSGSWVHSGSETRFCALTREWEEMGVESFALEPEPVARNSMPAAYMPVLVPLAGRGLVSQLISWVPRAVRLGLDVARRSSFDLVYATNNNVFNLLVSVKLADRLSLPCVAVVHHLRWIDYRKVASDPGWARLDFFRFLNSLLGEGLSAGESLLRALSAYAECKLLADIDGYITVSKSVASQLDQLVTAQRVFVVGNAMFGVSAQLEPSVPRDKMGLFVGRLDEGKGGVELVRVWERVVSQCDGAQLAVVGEGCLREHVEREVTRRKLGLWIRLYGFLCHPEIVGLERRSRLFISLSRIEGFGIAIADALASGLPVIAWDIPPLREVFGECPAVFLCPIGDIDSVVSNAVQLLNLPEERWNELSSEASKFVRSFSWKEAAMKELQALKIILEVSKSSL